ncbi:MAG: AAA family ATPase [Caldilineaceae bacterium]|nr:AAA family ATPase [Caldilineaceae bacterium]MDE0336156.1 AAA family ATPase [Caldilineaceae bacterium]
MIKSLSVKGLNNRIDADLEFNEDLNIITGKNGSGKTTLLKLLWYLISGNLERIIPQIPFQSVSITTDSFSLSLVKEESDEILIISKFLGEEESVEKADVEMVDLVFVELSSPIARTTKKSLFFPTFRRIEGGFHEGSLISFTETDMPQLQEALSKLSDDLSNYHHKFIASISTNDIGQLLEQKYGEIHIRISELQSKVLDDISHKIQVSASGEIESAIPQTAPSVLNEIQQLADERDRLRRPFVALSELTRSILQYQAIRVSGGGTREEDADGITLGEEVGEAALGTVEEAIASEKLSSGEKQMLSFLCYNAFSENTAIFIDEPELSLHVDWQRLLLPTLLEQGTGNQFFIATHSPFIYAKYPDKEIQLGDNGGAN